MKRYKDNLFAIEVPLWSSQFELYDTIDHTVVKYPAPYGWERIKIFKEQYKIIGTITAKEMDFDPTPYLDCRISEEPPSYPIYRLADNFGFWPYTNNPIESFRSYLYWYYLPENLPQNPDDWPTETPAIEGKLLLLQMVNFKF